MYSVVSANCFFHCYVCAETMLVLMTIAYLLEMWMCRFACVLSKSELSRYDSQFVMICWHSSVDVLSCIDVEFLDIFPVCVRVCDDYVETCFIFSVEIVFAVFRSSSLTSFDKCDNLKLRQPIYYYFLMILNLMLTGTALCELHLSW